MLKANVGLSRKITRDYNSTGYSVNLEGEIAAATDDPEGVLGRIQEIFGLANEALNQEIERDQGEDAIGRRDEDRTPPKTSRPDGTIDPEPTPTSQPKPRDNGTPGGNGSGDDPVTNKQVQFLFNLAKKHRMSMNQLEAQIEQITGRRVRTYDLTKREAGKVIDALNTSARPTAPRS